MATRHSQLRNIYHDCQRCGCTRVLAEMQWQNGILVCKEGGCIDKAILGSHDLAVVRAIQVPRHEQEPDPKLTNPTDRRSDQFEVLY